MGVGVGGVSKDIIIWKDEIMLLPPPRPSVVVRLNGSLMCRRLSIEGQETNERRGYSRAGGEWCLFWSQTLLYSAIKGRKEHKPCRDSLCGYPTGSFRVRRRVVIWVINLMDSQANKYS